MWDSEIDNAARGMTSGEPGGDLRARVLARIEERPRANRFGWMAVAAPLAGVAVIVLAFWVHDERGSSPAKPAAVVQQQAQAPARPTAAEQSSTDAAKPAVPVDTSVTAKATPRATPTQEVPQASEAITAAVSPGGAAAPLTPGIEPIVVPPVTLEAMQKPDDIVLDDLETAPIEIDEIEIPILAQ
jgi:hypothetical protein